MEKKSNGSVVAPSAVIRALSGVGVVELLEQDGRPTFILDLEDIGEVNQKRLRPVFVNRALRSSSELLDAVLGTVNPRAKSATHTDFRTWATSFARDDLLADGPSYSSFAYNGMLWTFSTLRERWRLVSGNQVEQMGNVALSPVEKFSSTVDITSTAQNGILQAEYSLGGDPKQIDWTALLPSTEHVEFFKSVDWSITALGSLRYWPYSLRQMTILLMSDPRPAAIFWGPQKVTLYNEAYKPLASKKHPAMMGSTFVEAWSEIADEFALIFADIESSRSATTVNSSFPLERHGYLEEAFFSLSIIPICADSEDGNVEIFGYYNPVIETTSQKLSERRTQTLLSMAIAPNMQSFWRDILRGLEPNELDIPFALLYSLSQEDDTGTQAGRKNCVLQGAIAVPDGHVCAPKHVDFEESMEGFIPLFRKAIASSVDDPLIIHKQDGTLPENLTRGIHWRGFGEPSTSTAVIFPLSAGIKVFGFLLIGLNPRRAYDNDFQQFVQLLGRQLSTSMNTALLIDQAELSHANLSERLVVSTQEAAESEFHFKKMAEMAPCGMFYILPEGSVYWANSHYYEMMGHGRLPEDHYPMSFMDCIKDEDHAVAIENWAKLTVDKIDVNFEFRTKTPRINRTDGTSTEESTWILAMVYPYKNKDGSVKSIMGIITDISQFKWAESVQTRNRIDAEEAKKQQERFMDITSHEMRNPLSAILQSADGIIRSFNEYQSTKDRSAVSLEELVSGNLDAANIIALCAQHQTRIINDVLTLSKLDSAMLAVTPVAVRPDAVVKDIIKMFDGEFQSHDIKLQFTLEPSYSRHEVDWVFCDPSRLTQVFINILTNAIKFTRSEAERKITVSLGASTVKPPKGEERRVEWFPTNASGSKKDPTVSTEWGDGEPVFLYFAVRDTGRGLDVEEKTRLFHRFSQASPRTHVQYGGSGLGLFISRELTELQGGEIGVASEANQGSTFAFYIKGRRTIVPTTEDVHKDSRLERDETIEDLQKTPSHSASSPQRPSILPSSKPDRDGRGFIILLVEDNLVNQRVLQKQLRNAGNTVHVANHGQEALDFLQQSKLWWSNDNGEDLDVVLLDVEMPVMDGLTCARRIRELQRQGCIRRHVPIIAVTANARTEQIHIALQADEEVDIFLMRLAESNQWTASEAIIEGMPYAGEETAPVTRRVDSDAGNVSKN